MRKLFLILIVLLLSVLAALWFHDQPGYVLVHAAGTTVQTSLFLAIGVLLAAALALYFLVRVLAGIVRSPAGMRNWWRHRKQMLARGRLLRGLRRLAEGDFDTAEKEMVKTVEHSETPLLHYLGAAWAAHRTGAGVRRDRYLALADRSAPESRLAVGLLQAQLYVEDGQFETAFATLNVLQEKWPRQPRVLELLSYTCERLGEWDRLMEILPALRRHAGQLPAGRLSALERAAGIGVLGNAAREGSAKLRQTWAALPRAICEDQQVLAAYVDAMLATDPSHSETEKLIRSELKKRWDPHWVQRYSRLEPEDPTRLLTTVEAWLKQHPDDPQLLMAAGKLALRSQLWGRGQSYLEAAVSRGAPAEAHYLLADVLERRGEPDKSRYHFRRGLEMASGMAPLAELSALEQPRAEPEQPLEARNATG
ncbi:MAG: hypothetical protein JJU06_11365 [Ectothiorhodospiraceae bacterium]|nr:hypothetical protein [Ectothiorhodospiraceae bacterium]